MICLGLKFLLKGPPFSIIVTLKLVSTPRRRQVFKSHSFGFIDKQVKGKEEYHSHMVIWMITKSRVKPIVVNFV